MHIQPTRRSSLFLLELIIAILFFSLASAVCVRFFVKSYTLERESVDLNHAVTSATSVAEILRGTDDPFSCLQEQFPNGSATDDTFQIYYDADWKPCPSSESAYHLTLQTEDTGSMRTGAIHVYKGDTSLYTLTVEKYAAKGADL